MSRGEAVTIPIRYHIKDLKRLRKKYKPGMRLRITIINVDGMEAAKAERKQYTVVRPYPYHVNCIDNDGYGHLRSFGYFELERQATII